MNQRSKKVVRYRKPISLNIGVVVFLLFFIYLIVISYRYFTKERLTIYEVTETRIADDNRITGLVLRNEIIVNATQSGYIWYYPNEGKRIAKNTTVYSIDNSGKLTDYLADLEEDDTVSVNTDAVRRDISQYKNNLDLSHYSRVYEFKYDLENSILESATGSDLLRKLQEKVSQSGQNVSFEWVKSEQSGIVSYTIDGMEGLNVDDVGLDLFEGVEVERTQLRSQSTVESGSPVYKLIPDEDWTIVVPLTYDQVDKLQKKSNVNIMICKDNLSLNANLSILEIGGKPFAKLDLNQYMVRYLTDRYLDVELTINSAEGLKIPTGSIFEKECFMVPPEFLMAGGDSRENGIVKELEDEDGEPEYAYLDIHIIMEDEEFLYIDAASLEQGDWIRNSLQERLQLNETKKVEGVYCVNEGFCKFKRIKKVYKNPEYCIIEKDTKYGLSVYDHIVVNPENLDDEDLIY